MKIYLIFLLSLTGAYAGACEAQLKPADMGIVRDVRVDAVAIEDPTGANWRVSLKHHGADGFLVEVRDVQLPPNAELILRRTGESEPAYVVSNTRTRRKLHIPILGTSQLELEVRGGTAEKRIRFSYSATPMLKGGQPFSFQNPPRFEDVYSSDDATAHALSKSVAALFWQSDRRWQSCTAFVISSRHLMTSHHCLTEQSHCDSAQAVFGYWAKSGRVEPGVRYECKQLITIPELVQMDLQIIELIVPAQAPLAAPLQLSSAKPTTGSPMRLFQHPHGLPMKLVRKSCDVRSWPVGWTATSGLTDLTHQCDAAEGSSGAPLLNSDGKVVAVHHLGYGGPGFDDLNRAVMINAFVRDRVQSLQSRNR